MHCELCIKKGRLATTFHLQNYRTETPTVLSSTTTKYMPALRFAIISIRILAFFNTFAATYKQLHNE